MCVRVNERLLVARTAKCNEAERESGETTVTSLCEGKKERKSAAWVSYMRRTVFGRTCQQGQHGRNYTMEPRRTRVTEPAGSGATKSRLMLKHLTRASYCGENNTSCMKGCRWNKSMLLFVLFQIPTSRAINLKTCQLPEPLHCLPIIPANQIWLAPVNLCPSAAIS